MCNPVANYDIYAYDTKEVKKAEKNWRRCNWVISWNPNWEPGIKAHLKASSFGATDMVTMLLKREEYEELERRWKLKDYTIYLTLE